jgi:hypothetical protein
VPQAAESVSVKASIKLPDVNVMIAIAMLPPLNSRCGQA